MRRNLAERQAQMRERQTCTTPPAERLEAYYTVGEVAEMTGYSVQTIIRIFERERGVLILQQNRPRKRKSYRSFRIPKHVLQRVLSRMTQR